MMLTMVTVPARSTVLIFGDGVPTHQFLAQTMTPKSVPPSRDARLVTSATGDLDAACY